MDTSKISVATGSTIRPDALKKETLFYITDFGAATSADPVTNTLAINEAIRKAASVGGGTVIVPYGIYHTYTILLMSDINIYLEAGATIMAARTDINMPGNQQKGDGGNYCEPEVNAYLGLQDHGHSYFANALVYGADLENISICGKGLFTGGQFNPENGELEYILQGGDPEEPEERSLNGHKGSWFGNKGIALVRCRNIILKDFAVTIGGHFAVITEGCDNLLVDNVLIDTTRDALDIDCCQNVTIINTTCNSLTDDGLCLKASFGAGKFMPTQNVLIENCKVSGYDAGSVYAGEYTHDKLTALDRCGPTGRVKFGTEATCGYHQVTIRRVSFERSRGFALEAVDCSSLTDVIFEDCTLDNVSSSPIFIRAGERGRFPVTGITSSEKFPCKNDMRIDNSNWILPASPKYSLYPAKRYAPHYNRTKTVTIDGHSYFDIVDPDVPTSTNKNNYADIDGKFYPLMWDQASMSYKADTSKELKNSELPLYANAIGSPDFAKVSNILIRNVKVTNADPRYPILIMGLTDSHIENVCLENITVEYRGGLTMEHAIEQRQLNTEWKYSQFHEKTRVQNIPWLVNTFFLKNEGLLPRADWNPNTNSWTDDPYNVPELPDVYPEPSNWGILPSYGLYARHADNITIKNMTFSCKTPDKRHVIVVDDSENFEINNLKAYCDDSVSPIALVSNNYRRHTNCEYVKNQPYFSTTVKNFVSNNVDINSGNSQITNIVVNCPAPGTPADDLYVHPTVPIPENGYTFKIQTDNYPLPLTVYRPFIQVNGKTQIRAGKTNRISIAVRNPATDISDVADTGMIYSEKLDRLNYSVKGTTVTTTVRCINLPENAKFDNHIGIITWKPSGSQKGRHLLDFIIDDGIAEEKNTVTIFVV